MPTAATPYFSSRPFNITFQNPAQWKMYGKELSWLQGLDLSCRTLHLQVSSSNPAWSEEDKNISRCYVHKSSSSLDAAPWGKGSAIYFSILFTALKREQGLQTQESKPALYPNIQRHYLGLTKCPIGPSPAMPRRFSLTMASKRLNHYLPPLGCGKTKLRIYKEKAILCFASQRARWFRKNKGGKRNLNSELHTCMYVAMNT